MKIRLVSKKQVKKAYEKKKVENKIDIKEELAIENIEKVPKELFQILGETLSFIENVNKMEGEKNEDK
ncbi:hypothetical protein CULT_780005 [[Clostridium] ultunense Esp]|uniref:Uncharacterized protein n=1 Tax=[Clostridium] ultunense Esp TaxID=1288971 RepID=M1ZLZ2_9FIRM|nr:hypothetical protein [Schnuerera ultunensis]CCQ98047.1 hypothetical protein CULT_780005 [[Clostridium] ultunense Esp]SHD76091.1 conserved protein of unknown function [[Clostridium] ultunense Esp]